MDKLKKIWQACEDGKRNCMHSIDTYSKWDVTLPSFQYEMGACSAYFVIQRIVEILMEETKSEDL